MKRITGSIIAAVLPAIAAAQGVPADRLHAVLPASIAEQVIAIAQDARTRGVPDEEIVARVLEAHAKGRSDESIPVIARDQESALLAARDALATGGHPGDAEEISAAAAAHAMGVDGHAISALASSAPSGRSLAVPLAVLGMLVSRGLPADDALKAVQARLAARASNVELASLAGEPGRAIASEHAPANAAHALGAGASAPGGAGGSAAASQEHPSGPPAGVAANGVGKRPTRSTQKS